MSVKAIICTEDDILGDCPNHEWVRGVGEDEDNEMCLNCQRVRSAYDEMGGLRCTKKELGE